MFNALSKLMDDMVASFVLYFTCLRDSNAYANNLLPFISMT